VVPTHTQDVDGSVDIDHAVESLYGDDPRWDYAIGYDGKICFVEIHPAYTSEVRKMISKLEWLKKWLKDKAPLLDDMQKISPAYIGIQSGRCAILPGSRQAKELAEAGLKPVPFFKLG